MTKRLKRKPSRAEQLAIIHTARGMLLTKSAERSFVERMAMRKTEDRELEHRRDEQLAALIRK